MQLTGEQEMFIYLFYYQYVLIFIQIENGESGGGVRKWFHDQTI